MLYMVQYGWETVLIQRILIGFHTGIIVYCIVLKSAFCGYQNERIKTSFLVLIGPKDPG